MNIFNRLTAGFYKVLSYWLPGLLFLIISIFFISAFHGDYSLSFFSNMFNEYTTLVYFLFSFILGMFIISFSYGLYNILTKNQMGKDSFAELLSSSARINSIHKTISKHLKQDSISHDILIKEARFYDRTNIWCVTTYKSLGLCRLMRCLCFDFAYLTILLIIYTSKLSSISTVVIWFVSILISVSLTFISFAKIKKMYSLFLMDCFYIVMHNIDPQQDS